MVVSRPAKEPFAGVYTSHRCGAGLGLDGGEAVGGVIGDIVVAVCRPVASLVNRPSFSGDFLGEYSSLFEIETNEALLCMASAATNLLILVRDPLRCKGLSLNHLFSSQ